MFKTIVAATDGSDHAHKAVDLATDLAQKYGAELVLLHVLDFDKNTEALRRLAESEHLTGPNRPAGGFNFANIPTELAGALRANEDHVSIRKAIEVIARQILADAKETALDKGVKRVRHAVEEGDPARCILDCARRENADLIVLGSRGLGDLKGLLLGSVSHKVSQLAECSCVTVK